MNPPSLQAGSPLRQITAYHGAAMGNSNRPTSNEPLNSLYGNNSMSNYQHSSPAHIVSSLPNQPYGTANNFGQYSSVDLAGNTAGNATHDSHFSNSIVQLLHQDCQDVVRGASNDTGEFTLNYQDQGVWNGVNGDRFDPFSPQSNPRRSMSFMSASSNPPPMPPPTQASIERNEPLNDHGNEYESKFAPFQALLDGSKAARQYRHLATRFDRLPYIDPESDPSIVDTELHRHEHIARIYNAMVRGDKARDNPGSIARKRWVMEAMYAPELVEAYAHKVFDCLIAQVKLGFRGWVHNDYVADERKGEDIDKDIDCAGRLDNIILALEQEKTICEDVMNSACQIRMFVNAPRAYANRKHQNRLGNSKRGKRDTPDINPRAAKSRRLGARQTRPRASTVPETPISRNPALQQSNMPTLQLPPPTLPYYNTQPESSPVITRGVTQQSSSLHIPRTSMPHTSIEQQLSMAISPPTIPLHTLHPLSTYSPRMATAPPHLQSPFLTPPQLSIGHFSAPATPDNIGDMHEATMESWMHYGDLAGRVYTGLQPNDKTVIDPMLASWGVQENMFTPGEENGEPGIFDPNGCVSLAEVECGGGHEETKYGDEAEGK